MKLINAEIAAETEQCDCHTQVLPVDVRCRGFVATSTTRLLKIKGVQGQALQKTVKLLLEAAERLRERTQFGLQDVKHEKPRRDTLVWIFSPTLSPFSTPTGPIWCQGMRAVTTGHPPPQFSLLSSHLDNMRGKGRGGHTWNTRFCLWAFPRCCGAVNETPTREGAHLMTPMKQLPLPHSLYKKPVT